ncbi:MAG: efflux RND transporter permease subunit, partial [Myxococcales bacterium]|nr:efflux RND transporter permease subunit [Myxococcales bacterium]
MSGAHDEGADQKGAIAWMARNPVAANLMMAVLLLGGILGLFTTKQEVFPTFNLDIVTVTVPYPGAGPEEVEQGILLAVEEEMTGIEGVKRVTGTAAEGFGMARAELIVGADADRVLADIKTAVDRITSFPEEAEEPSVTLLTRRQMVVSLVVSGDQDLGTLHEIAERVRERLIAHPDVTQADLQGVPPLEIAVEIPQEQLESYGLTPEMVAAQIRGASVELPAGMLKTGAGEVLVRLSDRRRTGTEIEDIVLRGTQAGGEVRLGDIAKVTDGYEDIDLYAYYDGKPAVRVVAYRIGDESPAGVSGAVHDVMDNMRAELPANVTLSVWDDDSEMLAGRIDLLLRNARMGLVLVLLVLALFLDLRLAFWVAFGIPISVMGAFALMPSLDISVNMISLFAFIVTLGIVVDDAIVVGENIYEKEQQGIPRLRAAVEGAQEMVVPVGFSILTTMVAFSPLLMVPGVMGKIFRILPMLVITVLTISWVESFLVLPSHLGHEDGWIRRLVPPPLLWVFDGWERIRVPVANGLSWFGDNVYRP